MLQHTRLIRACVRQGRVVWWQNSVGMHLGQAGRYTFKDGYAAERFTTYAGGETAPALNDDSLVEAGIPVPIERKDSRHHVESRR